MGKKNIIISIFLFTSIFCSGQKVITYNNQQWIQYYHQLMLSQKTTLYSDVSIRRINNFKSWSQITMRTGIGYPIYTNLQGVTGFACFNSFKNDILSKIEFRPYQEINSTQLIGKISITHRVRGELRYFRKFYDGILTTTPEFNFRFRYRLYCTVPLLQKKKRFSENKISLVFGDELLINAGNEIVYNMLDNNRMIFGVLFHPNDNTSISISYTNQFGQRSTLKTYENSDIFWLGITQKTSFLEKIPNQ